MQACDKSDGAGVCSVFGLPRRSGSSYNGGKVFTGCNIENASYTPTVCAERTAVFKAVSEGHTSFEMIAVAGGKGGKITGAFPPCGVCRQVLAEFCAPDFPVLLVTGDDSFEKLTLDGLLPRAFYPSYIEL